VRFETLEMVEMAAAEEEATAEEEDAAAERRKDMVAVRSLMMSVDECRVSTMTSLSLPLCLSLVEWGDA
jgi:hypothetical protein